MFDKSIKSIVSQGNATPAQDSAPSRHAEDAELLAQLDNIGGGFGPGFGIDGGVGLQESEFGLQGMNMHLGLGDLWGDLGFLV